MDQSVNNNNNWMESFTLNILASAYKCAPDRDSEAEVGWQWVFNLGRYHRITVITRQHQNPLTIQSLLAKARSDVRFEYYELPRCLRILEKGNIKHFIYYSLWQFGAFFRARKLVAQETFDLVHHFVFVNTWQPTYMAFLGIPFFFGPIGENVPIPLRLLKHHGVSAVIIELIGRFVKHVSRNYNPIMRAIYDRAASIIVINKSVYSKIRADLRYKTYVMPAQSGFPLKEKRNNSINKDLSIFRVLFVGRFVPIKSPDLAVEAFLQFSKSHNDLEMTLIGNGPMEDRLRSIIGRSEPGKVKILGWLERKTVRSHMETCDVFLFPTFEGGGGVVLEAMSVEKPIISFDFGGPRDYLTDDCGIKVKVTTRKQVVNDLAASLEKMYCSKQFKIDAGLAARKRYCELFTWQKKVEWMNNLYRDILLSPRENHEAYVHEYGSSVNRAGGNQREMNTFIGLQDENPFGP